MTPVFFKCGTGYLKYDTALHGKIGRNQNSKNMEVTEMCRYSIGAFAKKRKCHFKAMQTSRFVFLVIVLGLAGA